MYSTIGRLGGLGCETIIQGRKELINKSFLLRQLFKGVNYSREEIQYASRKNIYINNILKVYMYLILTDIKIGLLNKMQ